MGIGDVAEDRLFFTRDEVKERWRARAATSARNHVSVHVTIGDDMSVVVRADSELETVEAFGHEAADGSTSGDWVQLGAEPVEGREAHLGFALDRERFAPGTHRIGGRMCFSRMASGSIDTSRNPDQSSSLPNIRQDCSEG